jgi:hypothetical protein
VVVYFLFLILLATNYDYMRKLIFIISFILSASSGFTQSKLLVYSFSTISNPCELKSSKEWQKKIFTFYSDSSFSIKVWERGMYFAMCAESMPPKFYTIKGTWSMINEKIMINNTAVSGYIYFSNFKVFYKEYYTEPINLFYIDNGCKSQIEATSKWE